MFTSWKSFINWEKSTKDTIDVKKTYIDIAQDFMSGVLLSQIVYWYLPNKEGKSKLRVKKDGHFWIAKKREEWYNEIRFSEANYKTAIKKLESINIVVKERFKFDGAPTTHIRLNIPVFLNLINNLMMEQEGSLGDDFEEFNNYLDNEINSEYSLKSDSVESTESSSIMVLVDSTESNWSNQPNPRNGEINRMEMVESTDSITEITSKTTKKNTLKDLSHSLNIELPIKLEAYLLSDEFKEGEREVKNLKLEDILKRYKKLQNERTEEEFLATLKHIIANVDEIITFPSLFASTYEKFIKRNIKHPIRREQIGEHMKEYKEPELTKEEKEALQLKKKELQEKLAKYKTQVN